MIYRGGLAPQACGRTAAGGSVPVGSQASPLPGRGRAHGPRSQLICSHSSLGTEIGVKKEEKKKKHKKKVLFFFFSVLQITVKPFPSARPSPARPLRPALPKKPRAGQRDRSPKGCAVCPQTGRDVCPQMGCAMHPQKDTLCVPNGTSCVTPKGTCCVSPKAHAACPRAARVPSGAVPGATRSPLGAPSSSPTGVGWFFWGGGREGWGHRSKPTDHPGTVGRGPGRR